MSKSANCFRYIRTHSIGGYRDGCIGTKTWEKAWLCENLTFLFSIWLADAGLSDLSLTLPVILHRIIRYIVRVVTQSWRVGESEFGWRRPWTEAQSFAYTKRNCFIAITIEVKRIYPLLTNFYYCGKPIVLDCKAYEIYRAKPSMTFNNSNFKVLE